MKKESILNIPRMTPEEISKPISQVYEEINAQCNDFLKTQKGIQYLLLKYPKLFKPHYEKVKIINKNPRLFLGCIIHIMCYDVDIFH